MRVRGHGNYFTDAVNWAKQASRGKIFAPLGAAAGAALGGLVAKDTGAVLGGQLGRSAGDWLSNAVGFGDYKIRQNSLVSAPLSMGNGVPRFGHGQDVVRIRHSEFIGDVLGSTNFFQASYPVNPGMMQTFPWLSQVAKYYEKYKFNGLIFCYKTTSGPIGTSGSPSLGAVIGASQYNPLDPPFASKQSMESYQFAVSTVSSQSALFPLECAPQSQMVKQWYTRNGPVPEGGNIQIYDLANFVVATQGQPTTGIIGELWVTYDVEFFMPRIAPNSGPLGPEPFIHLKEAPPASATATKPFGDVGKISDSTNMTFGLNQSNPVGALGQLTSNNRIYLYRPGEYLVTVVWVVTGDPATAAPDVTFPSGVVQGRNLFGDDATYKIASFNSGTANLILTVYVPYASQFGGPNNWYFTIVPPAGCTGATCDCFISGLSPNAE